MSEQNLSFGPVAKRLFKKTVGKQPNVGRMDIGSGVREQTR